MNPGDSALDLAAKRLENALHVLEQRLSQRIRDAGADAGGLFDQDRAKLATELDLLSFPSELGGGLAVWHPKGAIVRKLMG